MGKQKKDKIGKKCDGCRRLITCGSEPVCEMAVGIFALEIKGKCARPHANCAGWDLRTVELSHRSFGVMLKLKYTGEKSALGVNTKAGFCELHFSTPEKVEAIASLINAISGAVLEATCVEFVKKEVSSDDINQK